MLVPALASVGAAPGGHTHPPAPSKEDYLFPPEFLWGSATSSHQVEGGNYWNDWWTGEQAGRLPHRSGDACRHYDLYEHDFDLAAEAGQNAHRFSIEWSRVEPSRGRWNEDAFRHYRDVAGALRTRGLEPMVTLHHFTLPSWVSRKGGWANPRTVHWFARYAEQVALQLGGNRGPGIRYWLTINEPTVYVKHAYVVGDWPPFRTREWSRAGLAFANLARAHCAARASVHRHVPEALVGFAHSAPLLQPCDPSRALDRLAAWCREEALNRAFFRALAGRSWGTRRPFDFLGLNYYTRTVVRGGGAGLLPFCGSECLSDHHEDRGPRSDTDWEVYPQGLLTVLRRFARWDVPLYVTENGVATTDEDLRTSFLVGHLAQVGQALREGIDLRGYFYWSLIDNYEWTLGTMPRFGLYEVDYSTQRRRPRPALDRYRRVCRSRRLRIEHAAVARTGAGRGHVP